MFILLVYICVLKMKKINKKELTQELLLSSLSFNLETGLFERRGKIVGYENNNGYIIIRLFGENYLSHRLAWFYIHGYWPNIIDHINGIKSDNRIDNLREVTRSQNAINSKPRKYTRSGHKGISILNRMYIIRCQREYISIFCGYFYNLDKAIIERDRIYRYLHGKYCRLA